MDGFLETTHQENITTSWRTSSGLAIKKCRTTNWTTLEERADLKRGISILPMNCQAYRDGYRYGAYTDDGEELHIVEFFVDTDEIQDFVNDHPEYGVPEAARYQKIARAKMLHSVVLWIKGDSLYTEKVSGGKEAIAITKRPGT